MKPLCKVENGNKRMTHFFKPRSPGGQHRASIGVRSLDGETPAEWRHRIRAAHVELGLTPPDNLERYERQALDAFERERERLANEQEGAPF